MPSTAERGCLKLMSEQDPVRSDRRSTRFVSRAARRSMGRMRRKKKTERIAKPFAARVCAGVSLLVIRNSNRKDALSKKL